MNHLQHKVCLDCLGFINFKRKIIKYYALKFVIILLQLMLFGFLLFGAKSITMDNSQWLDDSHPVKVDKLYLEDKFGVKESTIIIIKLQDSFFQQKYINELKDITNKLENIALIEENINTPLNSDTIINKNDELNIAKYGDALDDGVIGIDEFKSRFLNSIYNLELVSKGQNEFAIVVGIDRQYKKHHHRTELMTKLEDILKNSRYFKNFSFAGSTALFYEIDNKTLYSIANSLIISFTVFMLLIVVVYRDFYRVMILSSSAISAVLLSINSIKLLHIDLNSINIIIPVIAITIAVADTIHILNRYDRLRYHKFRLKETFKQTISPVFFTSMTTMVGFGSFYFSEITPLQNFSSEAFVAIVSIFVFSVLVVYLNLFIFGQNFKQNNTREPYKIIYFLYKLIQNRYRYIVAFSFILILTSGFYLTKWTTETNFLKVFFNKNESLVKNFKFFDVNFNGTGNFDIIIKKDKSDFEKLDEFNTIIKLQREIEKIDNIITTKTYADYISMINKEVIGGKYPTSEEQLSQEILFISFSKSAEKKEIISNYVNFDYSQVRINIKTPNLSSSQYRKLINDIKQVVKTANLQNYILTGNEYFVFKLSDYVIQTQIQSLLLCALFIFMVFFFLFGFRYSIIAFAVNFTPIVVVLGFLVFMGDSFDFATVIIAGIAIGFCVDDTIHMMHHFKKQKTKNKKLAILNSVRVLYRPLLLTTIILGICFFSFYFSSMVVTQKFGFYTLAAIILAFLSDIILLPALIFGYKNKN